MIRLGTALLFAWVVASPCFAQARREVSIATPARVEGFVVARNGKAAAGWCKDGKVRMWNLPAGQMLRSFELDDVEASQVCALSNLPCGLLLSPDSGSLLAGGSKGAVRVWDTATGEVRLETTLHHYFDTAAFSHDGAMLAVSATGEPAQIFDLRSKRPLFQLTSDFGGPMAVAFSPDGSLIASADTDTAIRVFDTHSGNLKWRFDDLTLEPFAVDFTADGKFVLAGGANKSLILVDAITGKAVRSYPKQKDVVHYLEVSPDGTAVAAVYSNEHGSNVPAPVIVFDIRSGDVRSQWTPKAPIIGGGWVSDGHLLVATTTQDALHIWSLP